MDNCRLWSAHGGLSLIDQVVIALLLGVIVVGFQTFSITQQPSWAQSPLNTTGIKATTTDTAAAGISPISGVLTLHPDSAPQFFKCGETPDTGLPTLPGLDAETSALTAVLDGDINTEILGKAVFDVTFSEPIKNGPGPDLILYEIGNSTEPFNVTLFSGDILTQSVQYTAFATGDADDCGFGVNIAEIDLSDFGIGEEGAGDEEIAITGIRLNNQGTEGCCTGADISDVFVVTTVEDAPLPPPTTPPTPTPTSTTCSDPPSGLVSWWPGDGNADDILGNNDGILQNGASFGSGIAGGQAFRLDGIDDFVEIPSMSVGNTFSIDFWVYPERSTGYEHLISNHYTSNGNFGALYLSWNGDLEYWQNGQAWFRPQAGSQTIQPNTWSHITLTYDGSVIRVYVNANELPNRPSASTASTQHSETFSNALRIGSSIPHESTYLQGLFDDVGIYNRALSLSEIQALSEGGKCSPTTASEEEVPSLPEQQQQ